MSDCSRMYREAAQAPEVVRRQLDANAASARTLGERLREAAPRALVTCARGSSDHAATFARYLIESHTSVLTSSAAPSLSSLYDARTDLRDVVFLAISQSGRSPDLLAASNNARRRGAYIVVLCNSVDSPLAQMADHVIPLHAGAEMSVAATKSYIASLSAVVHLVASWTSDQALLSALLGAPKLLEEAWRIDWSNAASVLEQASSLYVIGRGAGLGIAQEAALKLKETCGLHAEAFSAAEVQHGPAALIGAGFPVLILTQNDKSRSGVARLATELVDRGADVLIAGAEVPDALVLPTLPAHPVIEPLLMIQTFYRLANTLAVARGFDPDVPPHSNKITETT